VVHWGIHHEEIQKEPTHHAKGEYKNAQTERNRLLTVDEDMNQGGFGTTRLQGWKK
jgi:hypothetical protein